MRIYTNIAALNTARLLEMNVQQAQSSLAKLSSGQRINSAADDAAGLAVSERLRSTIRGTNVAIRNTQDGISMLQTAEGGAATIQSMLQRMRELAVQASSSTLSDTDRANLSTEFTALINEMNRTASSTGFNGIQLLGQNATAVQTAQNAGFNLSSTGSQLGPGMYTLQQVVTNSSGINYAYQLTDANGNVVGTATTAATAANQSLTVNGVQFAITGKTQTAAGTYNAGTVTVTASTVAEDMTSGFAATTTDNRLMAGTYNIQQVATLTSALVVNNATANANMTLTTSGTASTPLVAGNYTVKDDVVYTAAAVGSKTDQAGFTVTTSGTPTMAAGSYTIKDTVGGSAGNWTHSYALYDSTNTLVGTATTAGAANQTLTAGGVTFTIANTNTPAATGQVNVSSFTVSAATTTHSYGVYNSSNSLVGTASTAGAASQTLPVGGVTFTLNNAATYTSSSSGVAVGTFTVANGVTGAYQYNLVNSKGTVLAQSTSASSATGHSITYAGITWSASGPTSTQTTAGTYNTTAGTATAGGVSAANAMTAPLTLQAGATAGQTISFTIQSLATDALNLTNNSGLDTTRVSITSQSGAQSSIAALDSALNTVSQARANIGAYENRMQNAVGTMQVQSENLSAADSRIRDVDMSLEMANFTKFNILTQTATAMLAQANQQPQSVLTLLR